MCALELSASAMFSFSPAELRQPTAGAGGRGCSGRHHHGTTTKLRMTRSPALTIAVPSRGAIRHAAELSLQLGGAWSPRQASVMRRALPEIDSSPCALFLCANPQPHGEKSLCCAPAAKHMAKMRHTANSAYAVSVAAVGCSLWATLGDVFAVC